MALSTPGYGPTTNMIISGTVDWCDTVKIQTDFARSQSGNPGQKCTSLPTAKVWPSLSIVVIERGPRSRVSCRGVPSSRILMSLPAEHPVHADCINEDYRQYDDDSEKEFE